MRGNFSCALTATGRVKCWGRGTSGQLGNNDYLSQQAPVFVANGEDDIVPLGGVIHIALGPFTPAESLWVKVSCAGGVDRKDNWDRGATRVQIIPSPFSRQRKVPSPCGLSHRPHQGRGVKFRQPQNKPGILKILLEFFNAVIMGHTISHIISNVHPSPKMAFWLGCVS